MPPFANLLAEMRGEGPRLDEAAAQAPDRSYGSTAAPPGMGPVPTKTREAGGDLIDALQPRSIPTIEIYDKVLPESGMFNPDLGPTNVFPFQILAYKVPRGQALWLYDYEFWVDRLSGVDAGQTIRAEEGRFGDIIGFDVNVNGVRRVSTLRFALDPHEIEIARPLFTEGGGRGGSTSIQARARSFAAASGVGSSLLPLRPGVQGARDKPFTWVVDEGDVVVLSGTVFRPFLTPVGDIGGRFGGYLLQTQVSSALLERTRPQ